MKRERFYLACFRDNVGSNVAFHAVDGNGYVTDLSKAHVYTREEAQRAWEHARRYDQPISADHVDELAVEKVDCQYISSTSKIAPNVDSYMIYATGAWDGNDVYWLNDKKQRTLNVNEAGTFNFVEAEKYKDSEHYVVLPIEDVLPKKRRTFNHSLLNNKKMVQAAGLVMPDHVKKRKRRSHSGKTRWNCPSCGKIVWQYNPHDFERCSDMFCSDGEYSSLV